MRGGSHSIPGFSTCDDGIVIDLSPMKGITVDVSGRTATAEGGVTWGEFDAATQQHGLATTGGLVSTTGVAGFTLGGGIGWLMRKHGLACDNLRSAEVVTADGQILTASATENPDLFWGLRGGRRQLRNRHRLRARPAPRWPDRGRRARIFYLGDHAVEIMRFYREFARDLPDELSTLVNLITAPPAPLSPRIGTARSSSLWSAATPATRGGDEGDSADPRPGRPVADLVGPMPYVQMQSLLDGLWPKGTQAYMKAGYFRALDDHAIATMARFHQNATSPSSEIHIQHFGGAIARVGEDETAHGERQAPFVLNTIAATHEPDGGLETHIDWAQRFYAEIEPSLTGAAYINFLSSEGEDRVQAAYGPREVRPAPRAQGPLRPDQPVPAEPEHPTIEGSLSRGRARPQPGAARPVRAVSYRDQTLPSHLGETPHELRSLIHMRLVLMAWQAHRRPVRWSRHRA